MYLGTLGRSSRYIPYSINPFSMLEHLKVVLRQAYLQFTTPPQGPRTSSKLDICGCAGVIITNIPGSQIEDIPEICRLILVSTVSVVLAAVPYILGCHVYVYVKPPLNGPAKSLSIACLGRLLIDGWMKISTSEDR